MKSADHFPADAMRLAAHHASISDQSGDAGLGSCWRAITRATFHGLLTASEAEAAVSRLRELMATAPAPERRT